MDRIYKVVVYVVDADITADGTTPIETEAARHVTEAPTPWDAVTSWADQLSEEEAS